MYCYNCFVQHISSNAVPANHLVRLEAIVDAVAKPSENLVSFLEGWISNICVTFE